LLFLTGLEFREYLSNQENLPSIGTTRTYTFIGILGFILFNLDDSYKLYLAGFFGIIIIMGMFYFYKLSKNDTDILQILIGFIVYTYGPLSQLFPLWMLVLLFISIVFTLSTQSFTKKLTATIDQHELLTLSKFLLLSAVILPLLPPDFHIKNLPATPFQIWVAVVVISTISYLGYIFTRYLFKNRGYLITGLLGGLYSSTVTTLVLSRKNKSLPTPNPSIQAAITAASGMMYFKLLLLVILLNPHYLRLLALPLLTLGILTFVVAIFFMKRQSKMNIIAKNQAEMNPLELGTSAIFALMFVVMLILTQFISQHFGESGLKVLAFGVGFSDINPFVLSLLKGTFNSINSHQLSGALLIAAGSNNFLKGIYAVSFGSWNNNRDVMIILFSLGTLTVAYGLFLF
jgi:uncharacterized membrane protein (DUF4010 family)